VNVIDSSAWLEYFAGGPNASFFTAPIEDTDSLVVPSICLYEVFKSFLTQRSEEDALSVLAGMRQGLVVDLNSRLAVDAARLSVEHRLPLADSVILATARAHDAVLWTQDADFNGISGVRFRPRKP
jgi:predicted nucleic acid-binding protein